ncbi:Ail/Lom family outer membrane beta-barrel protein [Xenorhabdus szentirmaii]|uniref:Virulence membrane protein pagC n=2 Tax=Xenorhabdus szentirmaii TaxID=290112 RepID=W1J289_9GAMM|nr:MULTISPECIES: Ail/Lom family outer membrane beta-barrel protein [Xenorhabdus]MBD2780892.1 outer membrane beta-barrel protein [Xenorhabdus sp. 38]MBD2792586.1 outer membrane beta-barrel protein [Xenorhabdus sp. CUL]MBD2802753.1 outer membrane beta-barrel protein [Xenorhabdus sp. M]MBD2803595.1 outer membrane beta-barrel protein [Xenorhabdus sp. ZM]MBD2822463.1 outer membrane beta-barrel protein [Xenorhabdus sp. 42]
MTMKKALLFTLVASGFLYGSLAHANSQTVAIGFAQSKVQDFKHINGVNLHYRYEWDYPISIISSFTYMKGSENATQGNMRNHFDLKYYALMAGPAYRINDYVSVYGLLGFAHTKAHLSGSGVSIQQGHRRVVSYKGDDNSTDFAYGAGVEVNPMPNFSVYAGYEGSAIKNHGTRLDINGFNIGVGYRF